MDLAATSAGPWLVLGVVLGVLLAAGAALALVGLRHGRQERPDAEEQSPAAGWSVDDLPDFLERPPGMDLDPAPTSATAVAEVRLGVGPALLDVPVRPAHPPAGTGSRTEATAGRLLVALATAATVLIGAAAALAAVSGDSPGTASARSSGPTEPLGPTWTAPDVSGVPAQPAPGDPGAGELAASSVPVGPDGALARASFGGLVLERRAVGVTAAYPIVSVTASEVPGGPALAHLQLPVWNCLRDAAPADPVAAGCRRLPTEHAELGTPGLAVSSDGNGLRIEGRFPTYHRPTGSPPGWTGRVYPLAVAWTPEGGTVHLGTERATALADPRLTDLRLGR